MGLAGSTTRQAMRPHAPPCRVRMSPDEGRASGRASAGIAAPQHGDAGPGPGPTTEPPSLTPCRRPRGLNVF